MSLNRKLAAGLGALALALAGGCGSSNDSSLGPGFYITITSSRYSPTNLRVPPGGKVTVLNQDSTDHSVTSSNTADATDFTPGGVGGISFDTGAFTGTATFTIPANAVDGTVVPFYCSVHTTMMTPTHGSITVDSTATPVCPPSGCGGGGGGGGTNPY
jgi:plastocyanin